MAKTTKLEKNPNIMALPMNGKNVLSFTQLKSCGLLGYKGPRQRSEHEALPPQVSKLEGRYTPPVWNTRAGSDLSNIRSVGYPT
jgi:hypothetical protein